MTMTRKTIRLKCYIASIRELTKDYPSGGPVCPDNFEARIIQRAVNGKRQLGRAFFQTMTQRTANGRRRLGRALSKAITRRAADGRGRLRRAFDKRATRKGANGMRHLGRALNNKI